jgi:hypothetical protein
MKKDTSRCNICGNRMGASPQTPFARRDCGRHGAKPRRANYDWDADRDGLPDSWA